MPHWTDAAMQVAEHIPLRGRGVEIVAEITVSVALALLLGLAGATGHRRLRRLRALSIGALAAVMISGLLWGATNYLWHPVAEKVGLEVFAPLAVGLTGIFAFLVVLWTKRWWRSVGALLLCTVVVAVSFAIPHIHFASFANLAEAMRGTEHIVPVSAAPELAATREVFAPTVSVSQPLEEQWISVGGKSASASSSTIGGSTTAAGALGEVSSEGRTAERMAAGGAGVALSEGKLYKANIAATSFSPRTSFLYVPPAYFERPRPLLPVLVIMAGQPGAPEDWLINGHLKRTMDDFARQHHGLAPVVVSVDQLSSNLKNPLCSDTANGAVATYLGKDVPNWIRTHFQVDARPQAWAIGGLSNGGTCAMQVLSRKDGPYRTALNFSGEEHPDLGGIDMTIARGFDGSEAEFRANDPLSLFQSGEDFTGYSAACSMGDQEKQETIDALWAVCAAARDDGMDVRTYTYSGSHEWKVWKHALSDELPWLATKMNLIKGQ